LAFTDPTTNSGAAFRSGLAAVGGIGGLIHGRGGDPGADSPDAGGVDEPGSGGGDRSAGEAAADDQTMTRFAAQLAGVTGGPAGAAVGGAIVSAQTAASTATAVGSDLTNQMGVGHTSWHPDQTTSLYSGGGPADNGGYVEQAGDVNRPAPDPNQSDWGRPLEPVELDSHPAAESRPATPAPHARGAGAVDAGQAGVAGDAAAVPIIPA
jgi:hypothetical protein